MFATKLKIIYYKHMKMKDITNKTKADLEQLIATKRESLRVFRFGTAGAKTKNVKESKVTKTVKPE